MSGSEDLTAALFKLYHDAGTQVTYVAESGESRPYWANRLRQAIERAAENDDVEGLVERVVTGQLSRGFGYLEAAGRLDLTVEALVAERFRDRFTEDVVAAAETRLSEHGYEPRPVATPKNGDGQSPKAPEPSPVGSFNIAVTVAPDGTLSAKLVP
jgi:hypothetical protein